MKLRALFDILFDSPEEAAQMAAIGDIEIASIVSDSRKARRGSLFAAMAGAETDGHRYVHQALRAGAVAVMSERHVDVPSGVALFVRPDTRRRLAALAARFFGHPTAHIHVTGVTGTNGKSSVAFRTRGILDSAGLAAGLLGTIHYRFGGRTLPAPNTTPDGLLIQDLFAQMRDCGTTHAVIEVSSHALVLDRVNHVEFDTAVFTNISNHEHLDFHKTFEAYRAAKARLFEMLPESGVAVLNADAPESGYMSAAAPKECRRIWFGLGRTADVTAEDIRTDMTGSAYRLTTPLGAAAVRTAQIGGFNVMNDLAAASAALAAGVSLDAIVAGLERPDQIPGRLERIAAPDFYPIVDYAHNPEAMRTVLATLRPLAHQRLIIVFGAGGNRDHSKRPLMGKTAEEFCDLVFLTSDNSRHERTEDIIAEIESGMSGAVPRVVIPDREMAIHAAVDAAQPGDVILVGGKGHEICQIIENITNPFDDREVLRQAVAAREAAAQHIA